LPTGFLQDLRILAAGQGIPCSDTGARHSDGDLGALSAQPAAFTRVLVSVDRLAEILASGEFFLSRHERRR
jgi:hypothetical protein